MMIRRGQAGLWAWERARGQVRRFSDTRYARAARPEKLEEEGQYGWWPALDGEAYRQRLKTFSVRALAPHADRVLPSSGSHSCCRRRGRHWRRLACRCAEVRTRELMRREDPRPPQIVSSVAAAGYFMLNYERTDGREHAFSGVSSSFARGCAFCLPRM